MLSIFLHIWFLCFPMFLEAEGVDKPAEVYVRINQVGYRTGEQKLAILFSSSKIRETYTLTYAESGKGLLTIRLLKSETKTWGAFEHYYTCDFSRVTEQGSFF